MYQQGEHVPTCMYQQQKDILSNHSYSHEVGSRIPLKEEETEGSEVTLPA